MPKFGPSSLAALETCDEQLQMLLQDAIRFFDFKVIQGERGEKQQTEYYRSGRSKTPWPHSKHNCPEGGPSRAVDLAPWPIDWNDVSRFYALGGFLRGLAEKMDIPIRWGGDWDGDFSFADQTFHDLGHFELLEV
jgi:hypothetical protein